VTPSEIAFLGIGLVLGAGIGAALAQVLRGRPSARREVRLTITPNAIPASRTRTLAVPHATPHPGPIPGSPDADIADDRRAAVVAAAAAVPPTASQYRTPVPSSPVTLPSSAVGIPVERGAVPAAPQAAPPVPPTAWPPTAPGSAAPSPGSGPDSTPRAASPVEPVGPVEPRPTGRHPTLATSTDRPLTAVGPGDTRPGAGWPAAGMAIGMAATAVALAESPSETPALDATRTAVEDRPAPSGSPAADRPSAQPSDPFTMLVRPRPPVEDVPSSSSVVAAPTSATSRATGQPVERPAMPDVRLAAPSQPTLTRPAAVTPPVRPRAAMGDEAAGSSPAPGSAAVRPDGAPCDGPRRVVDERCALAGVARDQARAALDRLQEARRAYDVLREQTEQAAATCDPRRVAAEKDRLHANFRAATDRAGSPDETEAAARAWLDEINALNVAVREAARQAEQGTTELRAALPALERLSAEADAARIASENADAGCRDARQALAECEEAELRRQPVPPPEEPHPFDKVWPADQPELPDPDATPTPAELLGGLPAITRILRGDRQARTRLVATLATDGEDAQEWQLRVSRLIDAITARAIEDGYLDLPADDPFWRLFEPREARDIVGALSALGFRYDGLGGFADGRIPAPRDLSLAVGYAGLDRMRIRTWPAEAGLAMLYAQAQVAADEWLADQAGDLSLGRMVDALGGRAAELADIWNAWGRVRPALLAS